MGIKNFMKIIMKHSPNAITMKNITNYKDAIVGIDANLMIHKNVYAIRMNGYDLKNGDLVVTHLHTLLLKLLGFIKYGVIPVFVFDGLAPLIKNETLIKRRDIQKSTKIKYDESKDKKYYAMSKEITQQEFEDCKELIRLFGFTIVDAIEEADSQLVELQKCGLIDYIVSDDMDIFAFGGKNMLKNFSVSSNKKIVEIDFDKFKLDTGFDQEMVVNLAILLGCDYCPKMKGIGPEKAYHIVMNGESVVNDVVKEYFLKPNVIKCNNVIINKTSMIDIDGINLFLNKWLFKNKYMNKLNLLVHP